MVSIIVTRNRSTPEVQEPIMEPQTFCIFVGVLRMKTVATGVATYALRALAHFGLGFELRVEGVVRLRSFTENFTELCLSELPSDVT